MCVTVPVPPSSRSPLTSITPTASPGFSGPSNGISPARMPGGAAAGRDESLIAEGAAEHVGEIRLEARHHERRRDRPQQRAELAAAEPGDGADAGQLGVVRAVGERPVPVQRLAKRGREAFARQRELDLDARARRARVA